MGVVMAAALVLGGCAGARLPGWLGGDRAAAGQVYYTAVPGLAVHAEASGTSRVVGRLPLHARVTRTALEHGYARVVADRDGLTGWVDNAQLVWRLPDAAAPPAAPAGADRAAPEPASSDVAPAADAAPLAPPAEDPPPVPTVTPSTAPRPQTPPPTTYDPF